MIKSTIDYWIKISILIIGLNHNTVNSFSQTPSFLEPISDEYLDKYRSKVCEILVPRKKDIILATIVFPSFSSEWGIFIVQDQETYTIFSVEAKKPIHEENQKKEINEIRKSIHYQKISTKVVNELVELWFNALMECRFPQKPYRGLDGIVYEFSVFKKGHGYLRGESWEPEKGLPKKMALITQSLKEFCKTGVFPKQMRQP